MAALLLAAFVLWNSARRAAADYPGMPPPLPRAVYPAYGVAVDLSRLENPADRESALAAMEVAGLGWVRQPFPWAAIEPEQGHYQWEPWDAIVEAARSHHIYLIALLDTTPAWARDVPGNPYTPPRDVADFGRFARTFAERYERQVTVYQIWDTPNLSAHWGGGYVDAAAYMRLLREAYIQIKTVIPAATVLTAALAPTTESGPLNLNEMAFLEGIYAAGGRDFFDGVAATPLGFWSGPEDRRVDLSVLNFSRLTLLRQVIVAHGDSEKPIWAVSFGWNALPADWAGLPSPWGSDVDTLQVRRTLDAIRRARDEWPWLGPMLLAAWGPDLAPDDPRQGFALMTPQATPRLLYQQIRELAASPVVATVGAHPANTPAASFVGTWRHSPFGSDIGQDSPEEIRFLFRGTRLDMDVHRGPYKAFLYVTVDGEPANALPRDESGRAYLILYDPLARPATVTLARGLDDGDHTARIVVQGGWGQWAISGWRVGREANLSSYWWGLFFLGLVVLLPLWGLLQAAPRLPWDLWGRAVWSVLNRLDDTPFIVAGTVAMALLYLFRSGFLGIPCLVYLTGAILLRPHLGLALAAFSIPIFLQPILVLDRPVSPVEMATLLATVGMLLRLAPVGRLESLPDIRPQDTRSRDSPGPLAQARAGFVFSRLRALAVKFCSYDWAVLLFVAASALSLAAAENFDVAIHEFRVIIIEPVLFYVLLRVRPLRPGERMWHIVDALILGAVVISCTALYQYFFTSQITVTEGVRRAQALYPSPNNLSLFLDRIVPIVVTVSLWGEGRHRRLAYTLGGLPIIIALYLTFSKGAWLLGLPASLLFIGVMRSLRPGLDRKAVAGRLLATIGAMGLALLSLAPVLGTWRIRSLLDTGSGSTFFRLKLWRSALTMIRDHPFLGVGLDNFLYQYRTRYILPDAWQEPDLSHPHNILLDYWTRIGLLGVIALFWLQGAFWSRSLGLYQRLSEGKNRALLLGLMASMVATLAHGLIDNSYFLVDLAFVFFLTLGVMTQIERL
jgi:O-antigen ligase